MRLTKEEYLVITEHYEEIRRIIINSSCSSLSISLRQVMTEMGIKYKLMHKGSCSTCLYLAIGKLYDWYKLDKLEYDAIEAAKVTEEVSEDISEEPVKTTKTKRKSNGKKEG